MWIMKTRRALTICSFSQKKYVHQITGSSRNLLILTIFIFFMQTDRDSRYGILAKSYDWKKIIPYINLITVLGIISQHSLDLLWSCSERGSWLLANLLTHLFSNWLHETRSKIYIEKKYCNLYIIPSFRDSCPETINVIILQIMWIKCKLNFKNNLVLILR